MQPIRLYLIHGYRLLTEAVTRSLEKCPEVRLLGSSQEIDQALSELPGLPVELLLVDVSLGLRESVEIVLEVRDRFPELKILPLGLGSEAEALDLLEAGAHGYGLRQASLAELIRTIEGVYRGEPPCSAPVAASVCARIVELARARRRRRSLRGVRLTPREEEVLGLVAEGLRNKEIAARLHITLATVKNHVHNLLEKLQANGRREAIRRAYENGLLENPLPGPRFQPREVGGDGAGGV